MRILHLSGAGYRAYARATIALSKRILSCFHAVAAAKADSPDTILEAPEANCHKGAEDNLVAYSCIKQRYAPTICGAASLSHKRSAGNIGKQLRRKKPRRRLSSSFRADILERDSSFTVEKRHSRLASANEPGGVCRSPRLPSASAGSISCNLPALTSVCRVSNTVEREALHGHRCKRTQAVPWHLRPKWTPARLRARQ